jgi:chemotaxis protein MotB
MVDNIDILVKKGSIELRIKEKILFESGAANLRQKGKNVLEKLIPVLKKDQYFITVEGHTDNIPISTARYPTNWELSAARAAQVVRFLIAQGIDPQKTRAIGYADTKPLATNATIQGRAKNRRVSLIIQLNNQDTH